MLGVNAATLEPLEGQDHLAQSISDIVITSIGSRVSPGDVVDGFGETVSIREYGSKVVNHIDDPLSDELIVQLHVDLAMALKRWEPRFLLRRVSLIDVVPGELTVRVSGVNLEDEALIELSVTVGR